MMNKISFIIEFDEVSKTQNKQLTKFIEKTGIKFQVLESDNDLTKYKKYKKVIYEIIDYIETKRIRKKAIIDIDVLEEILKEVV